MGPVHVERIDPLDLDLDTAEQMAAVDRAGFDAAGLDLPVPSGPSKLTLLQLGSTNRPVAGLWLAREDGGVVGYAAARLPVEDNTDTAHLSGGVHPAVRRRGLGRGLLEAALELVRVEGRTTVYSGAMRGTGGGPALEALGFSSGGLSVNAVRRYDAAMAGRRQTVHRVLARHRPTGAWAGLSILCVDEFAPAVALQEDTSVVRVHRGHRLGLLMKADMLRWVTRERPEVAATDTWNATTNHHMIAVNERLGGRVIAHHATYRLREP